MLSSLREKQRIMDRVLQGDVDQYALDGADMKLRVPPVLQERMEKMAEQVRPERRRPESQCAPLALTPKLSKTWLVGPKFLKFLLCVSRPAG